MFERRPARGGVAWPLAGIAGAIALGTSCAFLPFLPGCYDRLAVTLSVMAQVFAVCGQLLVPVGLVWLVFESRSPRGGSTRARLCWARAAWVIASLVAATLALGALESGQALALGCLLLWALLVRRAWPRLRAWSDTGACAARCWALALVIVPVAVAALQWAFIDAASTAGRSRAIANAAPLLAAIERYRVERGHYPPSVQSLWQDHPPGVLGVERYHYERSGDAYNLYFEQRTFALGAREIVMFNPRDEHALACHDTDVLELSPPALAIDQSRGYFAVHATVHPHWRYFLFD